VQIKVTQVKASFLGRAIAQQGIGIGLIIDTKGSRLVGCFSIFLDAGIIDPGILGVGNKDGGGSFRKRRFNASRSA
jgi:hypothetical protein